MNDPALPERLGLIAGEGVFPFLVLEEARRRDIEVVILGIEGEAKAELQSEPAAQFHWLSLGQLSRCVKLLRDAGIDRAVMAGRVRHVKAFQILRPDRLMLKVLTRLEARSTQAMLRTLASVLEEEGVELLDSTLLLRPYLADAGSMTRKVPNRRIVEDLRFGLARARGLAAQDIGQTVVVKGGAVVAAEAMEGSDAAIRRAGGLVEPPFVVVKVARPDQDPRFDVPVVGPKTIDVMHEVGASALGLETGRVLLLEREVLLQKAEAQRLCVFGLGHD